MNAAYYHLATTHLPVISNLFGLSLLAYGVIRSSEELRRTALLVMLCSALLALPAYLTGAPAAGVLKRAVPGLPADPVDQHAEIAILGLAGNLVLGAWAGIGLLVFRKSKRTSRGYLGLTFILAGVALGFMVWTAALGGKIRHSEIRTTNGPH
jgi:hypothetical protein